MLSGWTDIINSFAISQFSLRLNCYEMLTLYIDNCRLQGIPKSFHGNYPKNSSFIMGIQYLHELSLAFVYVENWNHDPRNKFHAILRFPTGSFVVYIGDQMQFGVIFGPIWGSFAVGDHLRRCTVLKIILYWKGLIQGHSRYGGSG